MGTFVAVWEQLIYMRQGASRCHRATVVPSLVAFLVLAFSPVTPLRAQAEPDSAMDGRWHFRVVPFFWATSIEGSASVGGVPEVPLKVSFSEIVEKFDFGKLGRFEARKNRLRAWCRIIYPNLGAELDEPALGLVGLTTDVQTADRRSLRVLPRCHRRPRRGGLRRPARRPPLHRHPEEADRPRRHRAPRHQAHPELGGCHGGRPLPPAAQRACRPLCARRRCGIRLRPHLERTGWVQSGPQPAMGDQEPIPPAGHQLRRGGRSAARALRRALQRPVPLAQLFMVIRSDADRSLPDVSTGDDRAAIWLVRSRFPGAAAAVHAHRARSDTATSGSRIPPRSFPSRSTCGTRCEGGVTLTPIVRAGPSIVRGLDTSGSGGNT